MLTGWWSALLELIYPSRCPACRTAVDMHGAWCARCLPGPLPLRAVSVRERQLVYLDACWIIFPYDGAVKQLLHRLKFHNARQTAVYFEWLLTHRVNWSKLVKADLIQPVPLNANRLASRGFNQTELLFRPWADKNGLSWVDGLVRIRDTAPQWRLPQTERKKNIKGAFGVTRPEWVTGKQIIVVDDIFTTGFTLNECAKTLKQAGAKAVYGLALAGGSP